MLDEVKGLASRQTGIRVENMLISATHTHSAPSVAGVLGTGVDEKYKEFLPGRIVEAIQRANDNLEPARLGWTAINVPEYTHCRRWITRPDKIQDDVFGRPSVRANMHPGYQNPNFIGPAGPTDSELSMLAVQSRQGRPLAVLGNFCMHYFGSVDISADYFGRFVESFRELIGATDEKPEFVAVMSQGTSGDLHWMDYSKPRKKITIDEYSEGLAGLAAKAYGKINYQNSCSVEMRERKLTLKRRIPDKARLAWAKDLIEKMQGRGPKTKPEVYAWEQIYLDEEPVRELKLQVLRLGELGIAAIPCEVYGITGLKIKAQSPLSHTFNIELANGCEGYIPPPEQHVLGGYTTWPARSAGLEVGAEPRIVETLVSMLEEVSGKKRRPLKPVLSSYDEAVLKSKPLAYWCLDEMQGSVANDAGGRGNNAVYDKGIVFYLPGPNMKTSGTTEKPSRSAHFAGGRIKAKLSQLGRDYSVELWLWNGLSADVREFSGFFFSRGPDEQGKDCFDQLGVGGTFGDSVGKGKLIFAAVDPKKSMLIGKSDISIRRWNHIGLVRQGERVLIYLNGNKEPEISAEVSARPKQMAVSIIMGGGSESEFNFEGRIAKVAIFGRPLSYEEIARHYQAGT